MTVLLFNQYTYDGIESRAIKLYLHLNMLLLFKMS